MFPAILAQPSQFGQQLNDPEIAIQVVRNNDCWVHLAHSDHITEILHQIDGVKTFDGILETDKGQVAVRLMPIDPVGAGIGVQLGQGVNCTLFLGGGLLTVDRGPTRLEEVDEAWRQQIDGGWESAPAAFHGLVDAFGSSLLQAELEAEDEVSSITELLNSLSAGEFSDTRRRILQAQKELAALRISLERVLLVCDSARSIQYPSQSNKTNNQIGVRFLRTMQNLGAARVRLAELESLLSKAQNSYLAQLNVELGKSTEKLSIIVLRLTVLSALLLPLNFFAGVFGMNVWYPYRVEEDTTLIGFSIVMMIMVITGIAMVLLIWRLKWFV